MRVLRPILYMLFMGAACTGTSEYYKRPAGFTGVRGKRSALEEDPTTDKDKGTVKNGKETHLEIQKRVSPELIEVDESDKPFNGWIQENNFQDSVFKRAPSVGFFGMRGKKYFYDQWPEKRARLSNNFFGMRGKKLYGAEDDDVMHELSSEDKRAPKYSASFFGMRGKKDDEEMEDVGGDEVLSEAEKRARNLFFGMRGRRDLDNKEIADDKRAYKAFFGMRGKRLYEDYLDEPSVHNLYGMRGKKHRRRSNFFGMRGKKLPSSEFRGKFVGVRGKKSVQPSDLTSQENDDDSIELQRMDSNDLDKLMFLWDEDKSNEQSGAQYNNLQQNTMAEMD